MKIQIDAGKVAGVVNETGRILADKSFTNVDIIVGVSEFLGRMIVSSAHTGTQAREIREFAEAHLRKTVQIGITAENKQGNQIIRVN